jgi:Recombination endonuclease VII
MTRAGTAAERQAALARKMRELERKYGITEEDYRAMYAAQGGRCAICRTARGKAKLLGVDHDHRCGAGHPPERGCRKCVRGLLCTGSKSADTCNRLIGIYSFSELVRAVEYLREPPARSILDQGRA